VDNEYRTVNFLIGTFEQVFGKITVIEFGEIQVSVPLFLNLVYCLITSQIVLDSILVPLVHRMVRLESSYASV